MIRKFIEALLRPAIFLPATVGLVSLAELAIADRKYGVFSGGFGQSTAVDSGAELAFFAAGYLASQLAVALLVWKLCARLNRRSGGWPVMFHFAFVYGGGNLIALNAQYQLHSYFSDAVDFALVKQLGGGSVKDALLFSKNEIALGAAALVLFALVWWLAWKVAKRALGAPATVAGDSGPRWRWIVVTWLAFAALLALVPRCPGDAALGLNRMLAWRTIGDLAAVATDFDRDGYGLFGLRADDHPFDGARHPLALDVPGNGIDEDGYGGDLALAPVPRPRAETVVAAGQHVILVVLESTRSDALGKRIDGKLVAPHLTALAEQGTGIAPSYSHVAFTTASLKSIFSGSLAPRAGDPSLFTELKKSGYGIAVFSGQPEDFGDISQTVGMRRSADIFVDANALKDERAFGFAAQGSLLVDENVLLREFDRHLGQGEAWRRPQLVYLNFQSPHFPYDHPGVPQRFAHPPLARAEISEANRARLEKTYWNAVAHADAALGALIARLKRLGVWDDTILLVTGDHGEALFEDGFLGHGHMINDRQFATFLAINRPVKGIAPPIAISDYRDIVLDLLGAAPRERPRIAPFMHIGDLDEPSTIGLAGTPYGVVSLRLDTGQACFERPAGCRSYAGLAGPEREAIDSLVARWGSERWRVRRALAAQPSS